MRRVCRRRSSSTSTSSHTNYGTTKQSHRKDADSIRLSTSPTPWYTRRTSTSWRCLVAVANVCRRRQYGALTDDTTPKFVPVSRRCRCRLPTPPPRFSHRPRPRPCAGVSPSSVKLLARYALLHGYIIVIT